MKYFQEYLKLKSSKPMNKLDKYGRTKEENRKRVEKAIIEANKIVPLFKKKEYT